MSNKKEVQQGWEVHYIIIETVQKFSNKTTAFEK